MTTIPNDFDPRFIDVDLTYTDGTVGFIETDEDRAFGASRGWPSTLKLFESSEWRDAKREQEKILGPMLESYGLPPDRPGWLYADPWNDQAPQSSCVHNAVEACRRYHYCREFGRGFLIKASPMSSYAARGRGFRAGDYMAKVMQHSMDVGQLPESSSDKSTAPGLTECHNRTLLLARHHFHQNSPHAGPRDLPNGWEITAAHIRTREWIALDSDEEIASAMLHRLPILTGRAGHSIQYSDLVFDGKTPYAEYLDSYDKDRGVNGRLKDSRRMWNDSKHNTFALVDVELPDNPLAPFGADGKQADRATLRRAFPQVDDQLFALLYSQLPGVST